MGVLRCMEGSLRCAGMPCVRSSHMRVYRGFSILINNGAIAYKGDKFEEEDYATDFDTQKVCTLQQLQQL